MADFDSFYSPTAASTVARPSQAPQGQSVGGNFSVNAGLSTKGMPTVIGIVMLAGLVLVMFHVVE